MNYSNNVSKLSPSATIAVSTLAKKLAAEGRDIINLSTGEPDFSTPSWVAGGGIRAIEQGQTKYTPAAGTPALRQAVADYMTQGTGHPADASRVVVSAGAKQALFNACFCLFGPGDEVLIGAPYWTSYPEIVALARAEPVPVAGDEDRNFLLTVQDLDEAWTPRTRGMILSSPSNPTGAVYSAEELEAVARWARERDVVLINDEIYREIYFGDDRDRAAGVLDLPESSVGSLVVVNGMSKAFAMTGWRIGFSYTEAPLAAKMTALQSHVSSNAATPSQAAALEALTNPEQAVEARNEMVAAFRRRRDLVTSLMDELLPDFQYVPPAGAFYLYFRVDEAFDEETDDAGDVCTRILNEAGVALVPGTAFGDPRYARMSIAASDTDLEQGVRRMAQVLAGRPATM